MRFAFHEWAFIGLRKTHAPTGSTFEGHANIDDFLRFADEFGQTADPANQRFDLDGDGRIFYGDFFIFVDLFEAAGGRAGTTRRL